MGSDKNRARTSAKLVRVTTYKRLSQKVRQEVAVGRGGPGGMAVVSLLRSVKEKGVGPGKRGGGPTLAFRHCRICCSHPPTGQSIAWDSEMSLRGRVYLVHPSGWRLRSYDGG